MKKSIRYLLLASILVLSLMACITSLEIPNIDLAAPETGSNQQAEAADNQTPGAQPTLSSNIDPPQLGGELLTQQEALISLYENISPGVVSIDVYTENGFGSGSGFVIDKEGHIVTNYHVVLDEQELQVTFPSGIKTRAEVVGMDTNSDLAVISVDVPAEDLYPLYFGDSDDVKVGQLVVAIGSPFGYNGTMTTGIVSSLARTLESLNQTPSGQHFTAGGIIQTDAAINPGNSGGPLLNLQGEVIGVNSSISTFNTNANAEPVNSGIGFAVSVNVVKRVVPSLIATGDFEAPYLGISSWSTMPLEEAERLSLDKAVGALLTNIVPSSPAARAGLREDDVILQIDDYEILQYGDLVDYLFTNTTPGDVVTMQVQRNGEVINIDLEIGARP